MEQFTISAYVDKATRRAMEDLSEASGVSVSSLACFFLTAHEEDIKQIEEYLSFFPEDSPERERFKTAMRRAAKERESQEFLTKFKRLMAEKKSS